MSKLLYLLIGVLLIFSWVKFDKYDIIVREIEQKQIVNNRNIELLHIRKADSSEFEQKFILRDELKEEYKVNANNSMCWSICWGACLGFLLMMLLLRCAARS